MVKHVIKYTYLTGENPIEKNNVTIIEFPSVVSVDSQQLFIALKSKLLECHNLLISKFPNMNFGTPRINKIISVSIIN